MCLEVHDVSETESPWVAFLCVLLLKRGLNLHLLSLPAGSRYQRGSSLHFVHPQTSWVTFSQNCCLACLLKKTNIRKGLDHCYHLAL